MGSQDSYKGYSTEEDKCLNCGAVKVFSALVCPVCGMAYAESQMLQKKDKVSRLEQFLKNNPVSEEEKEAEKSKEPFDPNASFKEFKKFLNEDENAKDKDTAKAGSDGEKDTDGNSKKPIIQEESSTIIEEITNKENQEDGNDEEPAPASIDEAPENSGLYKKERQYRFSSEPEQSFVMSEKRPEPEPDQTIVPTRYGLDNATVREKREQSQSNEAGKAKMFSTTVNNHYNEYRTNTESSFDTTPYSSPYSRGSFDAAPKEKSDTWKKVIPLAIALVLLLIVGYFLYKLFGL